MLLRRLHAALLFIFCQRPRRGAHMKAPDTVHESVVAMVIGCTCWHARLLDGFFLGRQPWTCPPCQYRNRVTNFPEKIPEGPQSSGADLRGVGKLHRYAAILYSVIFPLSVETTQSCPSNLRGVSAEITQNAMECRA